MIKHRFVAWVVLGPLLSITALTQSNTSQASGTNSECAAQMDAYLSHRDSCSDYYGQLNFMKLRIDDAQEQRRKLLEKCKYGKDPRACEELAGLSAGRIDIMEQEYETLALRGCQTTALTPAGIAKSCKAGTDAIAKKAAANQNSAPPDPKTHDPVKSKTDLPQSVSAIRQQNNNSASNMHTRAQPISSTDTTRVSGGTGFSRQSDFSGVSRGTVNTPSPAPAANASSANASSAGAGRVKN